MYVCLCHAVTEKHIEQAVDQGATRLKDLRSHLKVATECGRCARCARDCLRNSISNKISACFTPFSEQTLHQSNTHSPQFSTPTQAIC